MSTRFVTGLSLKRFGCLVIVLVAACRRSGDSAPPRPPVVEVVRVDQRDVPVYSDWVATFDGYVNAQIQPQVTGYLIAQRFREGSFVRKDQILFEIDPRPFRATLDQSTAQLGEAIADEVRTLEDVKRDRPLAEARAIPRQQLDTDIQLHNAAVAAVRAARAAVRTAEINLGFTHVRSLIDGIVGVAEEQVGNLVTTTTVLTSVSQVEPIKAWFAITEQEYLDVADRLHAATTPAGKSGTPGLDFRITLADGSQYPHAGTFLFANRQVDSLTGTLRIATSFPNPKRLLRPGQFGRIRAATRIEHNAMLVPQRAVSELQGMFQVMVVNADSSVTVQPVTLGPQVDSLWVIDRGLKPGQIVIVEGTQVVKPGMKVATKPYGAPSAVANPDTRQTAPLTKPGEPAPPRGAKRY